MKKRIVVPPFLRLPLFWLAAILWSELLFRAFTTKAFFGVGLLLVPLFSLAAALLLYLLTSFFNELVKRRVTIGLLAAIGLLFCAQIVYAGVFDGNYFMIYSVGRVGQVLQFWRDTLLSIWRNLFALILMWVPLMFYCLFGRRVFPAKRVPLKAKGVTLVAVIAVHAVAVLLALCIPTPRKLYTKNATVNEAVSAFGLLTAERLDVKYLIFGTEIEDEGGAASLPSAPQQDPGPVVYGDNVIASLDFNALAEQETNSKYKQMHQYFAEVEPTKKNEYTGKFKGKNLIFIVAEGFSPYAVSKELTPTLYKLSHEGIQCTNYYTPGWGVSTSDGEYTSLLGLMPATGVHSMEYSADRNMYFSLGNLLKKQGYNTQAYHNHTYTYYSRHKSHPNLGYKYQGIGNGLTLDYREYYGENTKTKTRWPNSDYLMAKATAANYMDSEEPFHTYYLTVSGHMLYTFMGNSMSSYHKNEVKDLPYKSDEVKAYLACQIELDLMVAELIENLEARGIADDTVIVLTADHYPYGLQMANETDFYSELAGYDTSSTFEKYRNTLIMWHKGLESIVIDEPTYSIDLLPTLCNLFGLEYDSRLLMGRDFLSNAPALVCFANRSWITEYGRYDSVSGVFTPNAGVEIPEDYVKTVSNVVRRKFTYSDQILKNNYYNRILG